MSLPIPAKLVKQPIDRQNNFKQAGETYRKFEDWEQGELIENLVDALSTCSTVIRDQMIHHFTEADPDYGKRVKEGLKKADQLGNSTKHVGTTPANEGMELSEELGHSTDGY
jgi:catalase